MNSCCSIDKVSVPLKVTVADCVLFSRTLIQILNSPLYKTPTERSYCWPEHTINGNVYEQPSSGRLLTVSALTYVGRGPQSLPHAPTPYSTRCWQKQFAVSALGVSYLSACLKMHFWLDLTSLETFKPGPLCECTLPILLLLYRYCWYLDKICKTSSFFTQLLCSNRYVGTTQKKRYNFKLQF